MKGFESLNFKKTGCNAMNNQIKEYTVKDLKKKDRKTVKELLDARDTLLGRENTENYISEKISGSNSGDTVKTIIREIIEPYNKYLTEMFDCYVCSYIVDAVEGYDDKKRKKH